MTTCMEDAKEKSEWIIYLMENSNSRCAPGICARTPLFNIYLSDLLIITGDTEMCNYTDDTTYYAHNTSTGDVIQKLETAVYNSAIWFDNNCMKLNTEKCHLLIFGKSKEKYSIKSGEEVITGSIEDKLLGGYLLIKSVLLSHT